MSVRANKWLRLAGTIIALLAVWLVADLRAVIDRIAELSPTWVALAFLISLPQFALSAQRWRFTAARLNVRLRLVDALREYYIATMLNNVLPGGVAGDMVRVVRHARREADEARQTPFMAVAQAVIYERAAGQIVLAGIALGGAVMSLFIDPPNARVWPLVVGLALVLAAIALALHLAARLPRGRGRIGRALQGFLLDGHRALLAPDAVVLQVLLSGAIVLSYIAVFYCAGRAIGLALTPSALLTVVPLILLAMAIPISVAGWGVREIAAAGLAGMAGLESADAVAVSIVYGLIALVTSLPGAVMLAGRPQIAISARTGK